MQAGAHGHTTDTPSPSGDAPAPPQRALEQAAEWYALLACGEATADDHKRWQAWLRASANHRQAWRYVEQVSQRMLAPLQSAPDPRLATDTVHTAHARVLRRRRALAGLAGLAGAGLAGWLGWRAGWAGGTRRCPT